MPLNLVQTNQDSSALIKLSGPIDEGADYSKANLGSIKQLMINFEGVSLINSTGIQKWIQFLQSIPSSCQVSFEKCPSKVVNQLNLFPGFLAGKPIQINSFFAPYFCEKCDDSKEVLLETASSFPNPKDPSAPVVKCPKCSEPTEFDGIEEKYFLFLKR